ncbi:uncharacterized protein ACHE_20501A [Aspergillus chevalieri]|uniref:Uncharacterized protein n=1 Tax=Aspergillus chevalieri TaxID=182096 RepID=A0A7R7VJJ5_ASPCH|nr:uncharacterized protein ACHE_20501A [Aspergillus chevalieri]BCR85043.1 hypothetical protein ACHE_20501A [Aspergillus chevalieri]
MSLLIKHLDEKLLGYEVDPETAASALDGYVEDVMLPIVNRFNETPAVTCLQIPPMSDDCVDVFYEDAFQRFM